jgi:hypothetical protein
MQVMPLSSAGSRDPDPGAECHDIPGRVLGQRRAHGRLQLLQDARVDLTLEQDACERPGLDHELERIIDALVRKLQREIVRFDGDVGETGLENVTKAPSCPPAGASTRNTADRQAAARGAGW